MNTMTALAITKLDVLTGLGPLRVCTRYRGADDARFDHFPYHQTVLHSASGEYERAARLGRATSASAARSPSCRRPRATTWPTSPEFVGVPIALIGVGPGREQVIWTEAGKRSAAAQPAIA